MWIDAHHHLWDLSVRSQTWMDPSWPINRSFGTTDLHNACQGTPTEATIVVQTCPSIDETTEMLESAAADPLIAGVVGWLDLRSNVSNQLLRLKATQGAGLLVGARHQAESEPDNRWLCDAAVVESVRVLGHNGLAYDLLVRPHQLTAAIELARATEDTTRLVLDHCAKPPVGDDLSDWSTSLRRLAGFSNVACKLSGLVTEADWSAWTAADLVPVVDVVLECFGPERIMFGSDWPVCLLAASYAEVANTADALTADLARHERQRVFGGTAREWYDLK